MSQARCSVAGRARFREGLAVVSVGGAPAGGGGALRDLQRGVWPATVDPCAGTARNMLGVSGIVPDGVEAVVVTAADGTATRADVRDNGYAFVLPRPRRPEPRYLVWTGSDGAPHVQPLTAVVVSGRGGGCPRADLPPRVTPDVWGSGCGPLGMLPGITWRVRPREAGAAPKHPSRVPSRRRSLRPIAPPPVPLDIVPSSCVTGLPPAIATPHPRSGRLLRPPAAKPWPRPHR